MFSVLRAELRDSWGNWLGVGLGFVMTGAALGLAAMVLQSGLGATGAGVPELEASAYTYQAASNLLFCLLVGLSVIASSTSLVVDSRRGALARLALAGATPGDVVGHVSAQLGAVAVVSAALGDLLAIAALRPTLDYLRFERGAESAGVTVPAVVDVRTLLAVNAAWIVVVLAGGLAQARRASRIPPVEALRQGQGGDRGSLNGPVRWLRAGLALVVIAGSFAAVPVLTAERDSETFTSILQLNLTLLCVTGWFLAELGPTVVRPLTAAWTRLGPVRRPSWLIARATVLAKSERLTRSVTPVMFAVGLAFGVIGLPAIYNATFEASGFDIRLEHVGAATFLAVLGLPLAIAMCGSVGSLFMMSRQRQSELALLGIAGATPSQRTATATLEAAIVTGTAALLGVAMALVALGHLVLGVASVGLIFGFTLPVVSLLAVLLVAGLVTVAATVLPTLPGLRRGEPALIARLVAE